MLLGLQYNHAPPGEAMAPVDINSALLDDPSLRYGTYSSWAPSFRMIPFGLMIKTRAVCEARNTFHAGLLSLCVPVTALDCS